MLGNFSSKSLEILEYFGSKMKIQSDADAFSIFSLQQPILYLDSTDLWCMIVFKVSYFVHSMWIEKKKKRILNIEAAYTIIMFIGIDTYETGNQTRKTSSPVANLPA